MKILISNEAYEDLESIYEYISYDSIKYANETISNIYSLIYRLEDSPYLGRYVPELSNKKYLEIIYKSYRIFYEVSEINNLIYIHFIIHGKRNFEKFYENYIKNL